MLPRSTGPPAGSPKESPPGALLPRGRRGRARVYVNEARLGG